jgi:hypothetical protein
VAHRARPNAAPLDTQPLASAVQQRTASNVARGKKVFSKSLRLVFRHIGHIGASPPLRRPSPVASAASPPPPPSPGGAVFQAALCLLRWLCPAHGAQWAAPTDNNGTACAREVRHALVRNVPCHACLGHWPCPLWPACAAATAALTGMMARVCLRSGNPRLRERG